MGVVIIFWLVMISQAIWMLKPGLMKLTSKKTCIFFFFSYEISILVVNLCAPSHYRKVKVTTLLFWLPMAISLCRALQKEFYCLNMIIVQEKNKENQKRYQPLT